MLAALGQAPLPAVVARILPVDEAVREPALVSTRQRVINALRARDAAAVIATMHPEIALEAGTYGRENARLHFPNEDTDQLLRILQMGGAFRKTPGWRLVSERFCAPYAMAKYPEYDELPPELQQEPFAAVILGANVPAHKENSLSSPIVGRLSYDVVVPYAFGDGLVWVGTVDKPDGAGWVERSQVWAKAEDYFVCFGQFDGRWLMTEFSRQPIGF